MNNYHRPDCPACGMLMIVVQGSKKEADKKTHECLRCGHVAEPENVTVRTASRARG